MKFFAALLLLAVKINTANPTAFLPGTAKFPKGMRPLFQKLHSKSVLNDVDEPWTIRDACVCVSVFLHKIISYKTPFCIAELSQRCQGTPEEKLPNTTPAPVFS